MLTDQPSCLLTPLFMTDPVRALNFRTERFVGNGRRLYVLFKSLCSVESGNRLVVTFGGGLKRGQPRAMLNILQESLEKLSEVLLIVYLHELLSLTTSNMFFVFFSSGRQTNINSYIDELFPDSVESLHPYKYKNIQIYVYCHNIKMHQRNLPVIW